MKADISLAERRRLEREQQAEIRAMLAPRHFATMREQMAVDAALFQLRLEHLQHAAPAINAILAGMGHAPVPVAKPVVMPEPVASPVPAPSEVRPLAPDGLRERLGLR